MIRQQQAKPANCSCEKHDDTVKNNKPSLQEEE
jgi:hypothetical protein